MSEVPSDNHNDDNGSPVASGKDVASNNVEEKNAVVDEGEIGGESEKDRIAREKREEKERQEQEKAEEKERRENEKREEKERQEREKAEERERRKTTDAEREELAAMASTACSIAIVHRWREEHNSRSLQIEVLRQWNTRFQNFFAFRRTPFSEKLDMTLTRIKNSSTVTEETKAFFRRHTLLNEELGNKYMAVTYFGQSIKNSKDNLVELPEGGGASQSVLALNSMDMYEFMLGKLHYDGVAQLKDIVKEIETSSKAFDQMYSKEIHRMIDTSKFLIKQVKDMDDSFSKYSEMNGSTESTLQKDESLAYTALSKARVDLFICEQKYRENMLKVTKNHQTFFEECTKILNEFDQADKLHASNMHKFMTAGMQLLSAIRTKSLQLTDEMLIQMSNAPQRALDNQKVMQDQLYKSSLKSSNVEVDQAGEAKPPGTLPPSANIIAAGTAKVRKGMIFKDFVPILLVLTRDYYLHAYQLSDLEQGEDCSIIYGPGAPTNEFTTDANKVRFLMKDFKAPDKTLFTADALNLTAEECPAKEKDQENAFILKLHSTGVFSSSFEEFIKLASTEDKQKWVAAINASTGARITAEKKKKQFNDEHMQK